MLLVIDVGNTNTVMGIYDGSKLVIDWRIRTERNTTADEFYVLTTSLFAGNNIRPKDITRTIISSVVPPMVNILDAFCRKYMAHEPIWVDAKSAATMPILYSNPDEVGADRIVNAVAAFHEYRTSLIIIAFGTSAYFDAISQKSDYWNSRMRQVSSIQDPNRRNIENEKLLAEMMEDPVLKKIARKVFGFGGKVSFSILQTILGVAAL